MTEGQGRSIRHDVTERQNTKAADRLALLTPTPLVAFALFIAALATRLSARDCGICKGNEAVEAVFIQQMVERGELPFPSVNGGHWYKPPLH